MTVSSNNKQNPELNNDEKLRKDDTPEIIAFRKSCDASGTGLSHYILTEAEDK